jgi:hypothetical protein
MTGLRKREKGYGALEISDKFNWKFSLFKGKTILVGES